MDRRSIEVPPVHAGEAVARIIHDALAVPHSTAKGLIDAGCVTVNGRPVTSHGQRCDKGDMVEIAYDPNRQYRPQPPTRRGAGFRIVHEDREIVVADKMPGVLSSPAPGEGEESLAGQIAASLRSRGIRRPQLFVVHRLDRHTSGLLVLARTPRALESLTAQFESRQAGREYIALVDGSLARDRGTIQSWLLEDPKSLSVRTTDLRGAGKKAITHFEVIERFETATLLRVRLETGRKHQIRIHLAEIGHPVIGDRRYGGGSDLIDRVALHAQRLTFRHPFRLETVSFEAPIPEDLTGLLAKLRRRRGTSSARTASAETSGSPAMQEETRASSAPQPEKWMPRVVVLPKGLVLSDPIAPKSYGIAPPLKPSAAARPDPGIRKAAEEGTGARGPERASEQAKRARLLRERAVGAKPWRGPAPKSLPPPSEKQGARAWRGKNEPGEGRPEQKPKQRPRFDRDGDQGKPDQHHRAHDKERGFRARFDRDQRQGKPDRRHRGPDKEQGFRARFDRDQRQGKPDRHHRAHDKEQGFRPRFDRDGDQGKPDRRHRGPDKEQGFRARFDRDQRQAKAGPHHRGPDKEQGFRRGFDRDQPQGKAGPQHRGRDKEQGFRRRFDRDQPQEKTGPQHRGRDKEQGFRRGLDRDQRQAKPDDGGPASRDSKPWEFRQKGMTFRREKRRKIKAANSKRTRR